MLGHFDNTSQTSFLRSNGDLETQMAPESITQNVLSVRGYLEKNVLTSALFDSTRLIKQLKRFHIMYLAFGNDEPSFLID
jgi:hypothetical protein